MSGGQHIKALSTENPNVDVVRYTHKSRVWTTRHVDYYSEALAIGLLEMGLTSGDVVLSWLPNHFSEQVGSMFATYLFGVKWSSDGMLNLTWYLQFFIVSNTDGSSICLLQGRNGLVHSGSYLGCY